MHQDSTTRIVVDQLVVEGEQAAITESLKAPEALPVSSHAVMLRCYRQIQMTPHQQLVALKLAILPLGERLELSSSILSCKVRSLVHKFGTMSCSLKETSSVGRTIRDGTRTL